jgi:spore germination protein YaaH
MTISQALHSIPAHKLVLGIPLYGYEWETLRSDPESATVPGTGKTMSNTKVLELLSNCGTGCQTGYQDDTQQPYVLVPSEEDPHVTRQIFYEDATSLTAKLQFAQKLQLGGVALWALGYDSNDGSMPLNAYAATVLPTLSPAP